MSAFDKLKQELAAKGVRNPGGLAYAIGRKKYGASTMAKAASRGVSAKSVARDK